MTEFLAADHLEVDALFRDLAYAFDRGDAREVLAKLDYLWARLAIHIRAEHLHLFPALVAASAALNDGGAEGVVPAPEEVGATVERLREDHNFFMRELAGAVGAARELTAGSNQTDRGRLLQLRDAVFAVAARLVEHNRVEEEYLYRWPEMLLGSAELDSLRERMKRELEGLPPRFSVAPDAKPPSG